MKKVLLVVDMQNDFISGPLGSPAAQAIVPAVAQRVEDYLDATWQDTMVYFTRDTHDPDTYAGTIEGKKLPVPHCYRDSYGWEIEPSLMALVNDNKDRVRLVNKDNFGSLDLVDLLEGADYIEICGVCTDICVVSNALILKAADKYRPVVINPALCAGTSKENHDAAILTMKNCQVDILD